MATALAFSSPSLPQVIISKCDGSNYLGWASRITPILRSNELMAIVDGTETQPPEFLNVEGDNAVAIRKSNPEFLVWYKKDQYCLSWINSTLTDRVLSHVFHLKTFAAVWSFLASKYSGKSKTDLFDLRRKLQTLSQGTLSCGDYIDSAKRIAAELRMNGTEVIEDVLISYIAGDLHSHFDLFMANINIIREGNPMSIDQFEKSLLSYAAKMPAVVTEPAAFYFSSRRQQHRGSKRSGGSFSRGGSTSREDFSPRDSRISHSLPQGSRGPLLYQAQSLQMSRNFQTQRDGLRGRGRLGQKFISGPGRGSSHGSSGQQNFLGSQNHSHGPTDGYPEYSGDEPNPNAVICQISDRYYHTALDCYQRMNFAFQGRHPPAQLTALAAQANLDVDDSVWFVDSGANEHIANATAPLAQQQPYSGSDSVTVGNGTGQQDRTNTAEGPE